MNRKKNHKFETTIYDVPLNRVSHDILEITRRPRTGRAIGPLEIGCYVLTKLCQRV